MNTADDLFYNVILIEKRLLKGAFNLASEKRLLKGAFNLVSEKRLLKGAFNLASEKRLLKDACRIEVKKSFWGSDSNQYFLGLEIF